MKPSSHFADKPKAPDFGQFLRELRLKAHLTQKFLSGKFGIKKETISSWENRHSFPSDKYLKAIADFFHIPLKELEKVKARHRSDYKRNLILNSQDPVVTAAGSSVVPLLDETVKALPLDEIKHPAKWKGPRHTLPPELFAGTLFAFRIPDASMEPLCGAGDVVVASLHEKPKSGAPVLIKVKAHPPRCRLYLGGDGTKFFATPENAGPAFRVREPNIEWCCVIVSGIRKPADIFS